MRWLIIKIIRFYQRFISPLKQPSCRFTPTCSSYMLICVQRFGAFKGLRLGLRRISKCHPFHEGGFDPPPQKPLPPDSDGGKNG